MEIPPYPVTKRGEKFESASIEMNVIVEEFFQIKNDHKKFIDLSLNLKNETILIVNSCGDAKKDRDILRERLGKS